MALFEGTLRPLWDTSSSKGWLPLVAMSCLALAWTAGLCTVIYRLWFHPLAKYPGPWYMKISPLYDFYIGLQGRRHLHFEYLHKRYGTTCLLSFILYSLVDRCVPRAYY